MGVQTKDRKLNLVLVGMTGAGMSAAGNTILGEKEFKSKFSARSVTQECEKKEENVSGRPVAVIDTPGLFSTKRSADVVEEEIMKCVPLSAPGPHAFLLVIKLGRMTEEVKETVEQLQEMFGEEAVKHTILLFTHGDKLKNTKIEKFLEDSDKDFQQLVKKFGNRYHVFNNKNMSDRTQVTELLEKIDRMAKEEELKEKKAVRKKEVEPQGVMKAVRAKAKEINHFIKDNEWALPVIAGGAMLGLGLGLGIGAVAVGGATAKIVGAVAGVIAGGAAAIAGVVGGPGVGAGVGAGVGMAVGGAAALLLAGPAVGTAAAAAAAAAAGGAVIGGGTGLIGKGMGGRGAGEDQKNK